LAAMTGSKALMRATLLTLVLELSNYKISS
jgi:hypothetical protein